ncbi:hypothetical protein [Deinococcus altitudinis]|uniref:hypothetical protein n=1 Tax=Deinococcus altitudinis TaxID=468914 RepID=UPI003892955E
MEVLTFVRIEGDTALFTKGEGAEREFKILTRQKSPMYVAQFENHRRFSFVIEMARGEYEAQPSYSRHDAEHAVELLVERCKTMGPVVYMTPETAWEA